MTRRILKFKLDHEKRMHNAVKCNIYKNIKHRPNTTWLGTLHFEGIPENFILNMIVWLILVGVFIIMRKKAWNYKYGRMAVVKAEDVQLTHVCFEDHLSRELAPTQSGHNNQGPDESPDSNESIPATSEESNGSTVAFKRKISHETELDHVVFHSVFDDDSSYSVAKDGGNQIETDSVMQLSDPRHNVEGEDSGYFTWIKFILTLTDEDYRAKCGPDCVTYLSFQRHLIVLAVFITITSLVLILPLNMYPERTVIISSGRVIANKYGFSKTTIVNLAGDHVNFLWAHLSVGCAYLLVTVVVMKHFSQSSSFHEEGSSDVPHTICIIGIDQNRCLENIVRAHLEDTYPGVVISEVSFAYNVSKLKKIEASLRASTTARIFYEKTYHTDVLKYGHENASRPQMRPYKCGVLGCCCGCKCCGKHQCTKTDAIDYYKTCEDMYQKQVEEAQRLALSQPLGIAFVTFGTVEAAERIVLDYERAKIPCSKYSSELNSYSWKVSFAPDPEDIKWQNLSSDSKWWYCRFIGVNFLMLIPVVIFTTPVLIFNTLLRIFDYKNKFLDIREGTLSEKLICAVMNTMPSLIVYIFKSILIYFVASSDQFIGFWSKTSAHLSAMMKEFFFLVLMIQILPSVGVQTILAVFHPIDNDNTITCIFYKDNGATFVMYVCTSSLIGAAGELLRIPSTFRYAVKILFARSLAEKNAIRHSMMNDFPIGHAYAWMMLHFTIFTSFSIIYPLITPFGLLYLVSKHCVDRYHIYFSYDPCKVKKELHSNAVNFCFFAIFLLHLNLLIYIHSHLGGDIKHEHEYSLQGIELRALQVISLLGFSFTSALCLGQVCCKVCVDITSIRISKNQFRDEEKLTMTVERNSEKAMGEGDTSFTNGLKSTPVTVANNYTDSGQPYGRYIAPMLRSEFVRLAQTSTNDTQKLNWT